MAIRETVSQEALERAIRGRIVAQHGARSAFVTTPITVQFDELSDNGSNWSLVLPQDITPDCQSAVAAAAIEVGARMSLATGRPGFGYH